MCRSALGRKPALLAGLVFVGLLAAAYGYLAVFSGRSAMVHLGALIGTIMAVNVFALIIPGQKKITAALTAGREPDPALGALAKQRSVHNTYLTLPVLVFMVSGHYPILIGHPQAWLLAGLVIVGGAAARHLLMRHEAGDPFGKIAWTLPVIAVALIAALWLTAPAEREAGGATAADADVLAIVPLRRVPFRRPAARGLHRSAGGHGDRKPRRRAPAWRVDRPVRGAHRDHAARQRDRHDGA